ncbi:23S rRNA (uracil(1939)-C(5))-methyltransferase RlmD [Halomonas sp. TD01]|uniref:23S rRNA (uracil(1939)-C(5))-methyltransferase RlmD n=1 Tax=Halomonas sp. TD01 TaxID=999141 RepID=UPI000214EEEE|nr:23S rRNA (uracil(1939)-C(5))-methyltransferase RlmD [Halomonas sp. TD01]EGP20919.1 23S rRNA 5-methyluridine methyltransferase [Halomonas sp. TD01]CAH1044271.1 23S rRNA (uracil(1939)-C(5))-methyltransferase (EC [Halomonas sp. TD01]
MAMLGKRRPPRPASGHSGLVRKPSRKIETKDDTSTTLVVERLAHDGRGVAHNIAGKTVFIDQALPGEHVDVAVHVTRKRYDEAHIKARLTTSEQRVEPPCVYFGQCGGCDLQHLNLAAQRQHKREVVTELMARQGLTLGPIAALDGSSEHYRRRARLGVRVDGQGNVLLGFRAPNSHRLVDIEQCHVLVPALNELILPLRQLLATLESPRLVGHVELLATNEATVVLVRQLKAHDQDMARWQQFAEQQHVSLGTWLGRETPALHWNGAHSGAVPVLQEVLNLDELEIQRASLPTSEHRLASDEAFSLLTLRFSPGDFLQVNAEVNQKMVAQVVAWLKPAPGQQFIDLFAGIGNFSLPLAAAGAKVVAVEGNPAMVERITTNADANQLDVDAQQADLSDARVVQMLLSEHQQIDAIVLDPPRSGAEAVCQVLGSYNIPRVAYISCDPATLARDAAHLVHAGYRVKQVAVADMFIHTAHLETLMLFEYEG